MIDTVRETALKALYDVYENKAYSNQALSRVLDLDENNLRPIDKAFITEIFYGTLKYTLTFDYLIGIYSKIKVNKISKWTLHILRMGLYQIFFMDKVPVSAACDECVKLAGRYGHEGTKRFVNGLLRNIIRNTSNAGGGKLCDFPSLSEKYGYSKWITDIFIEQFGEEFTEEMMRSNMESARMTIRTNILKITCDQLIERLVNKGVQAIKSGVYENGIIINKSLSVTNIDEYKEGLFYIQGESSMLAAAALNPRQGEKILDLCAAPGGKTTHIAELMGNKGEIIACDIFQNKLKNIEQTADRLGINIIKTIQNDASVYNKDFTGAFDRVLADVPCSGTGVIRSRPEMKFTKTKIDFENLTRLQYSILKNAAAYVKPGGVLVYGTCSVLEDENMKQIDVFLKENEEFKAENIKKIFPQDHRSDGFFISQMRFIN